MKNFTTVQEVLSFRAEFDALDSSTKKRKLGTILFPLIQAKLNNRPNGNQLTPRVTGMLIDLDVLNVNDILESIQVKDILDQRISEAIELINEADN